MENYTKRLEKIGKEPSAAVIKRINEYNELQELLANNQGRLEEADVDDQLELKEEIKVIKAGIRQAHQRIHEAIDAWEAWMERKEKKPAEPTPSPKPDPKPAAAPKPVTTPSKEGNSVGWMIFGAFALVVTFGAVNAFKK